MLETLQVFPKNILTAFELNVKTYWPQQTTKKDGTTILSSGMRPFLLGGTWSLAEAHTEEPSATMAKVKKYLDAVIFMQYVQQQAVSDPALKTWRPGERNCCPDLRGVVLLLGPELP